MRLVRDGDGRARFDRDGTATGRGAYVCPATDCVGKAVAMGRLSHAFRSPVRAPLDGEADILEHWQRR